MRITLDEGAFAPIRAHNTDAGLDLLSPTDEYVEANGHVVIDTGVHVELPKGTAGILCSKSGLNIQHDITSTGVVDEGYTGSIRVKLYNNGDESYHIRRKDKISQLLIVPVLYEPIEITDSINGGDRGDNGFGSTGR